jgi:hypothetical protein
MQNENSPAFPQQEQTYDEDCGRWTSGPSQHGFTKREWITLEMLKALVTATLPQSLHETSGKGKTMVPHPRVLASLANIMAEALLEVFDQNAAAQAASHPLNQRPRPEAPGPNDLEFTDD